MDNDNYRAITSMASCQADKDKVVRMADFLTHHRQYTTVPDPYYGDYSGVVCEICVAKKYEETKKRMCLALVTHPHFIAL